MRKLWALIYKDILLLVKDKAGLALLFIMPVSLVFIMTYLQDNTFRAVRENRIPLAVLNNDGDSLGTYIICELRRSEMFELTILKQKTGSAKFIRQQVA